MESYKLWNGQVLTSSVKSIFLFSRARVIQDYPALILFLRETTAFCSSTAVWLLLKNSSSAQKRAKRCADLGFHAENVILEKGPFTVQQNIEHLKKSEAEILVTKESGEAGGFPEKAEAASLCGAELLTLRRPAEIGKPLTQIERLLETEFK